MIRTTILRFLLLLWICQFSVVANAADPKPAIINCTLHGFKKQTNPNWLPGGVILYKIINGAAVKVEMQRPDGEGNFSYTVHVKEGIYYLAKPSKDEAFKYVLYLKGGEQKKIDFYKDYDSCLVDQPNSETRSLQAWTDTFNRSAVAAQRKPAESYRMYDELVKFASSFLKSGKTTNTYFNTWLADKIDTDLKFFRAANYFRFGRLNGTWDSGAANRSFYQPLTDKKIINDVRLLHSEHGLALLDYMFAYQKVTAGISKDEIVASYFSPENAGEISNSAVKVAFLLYKMPGIREYEVFVKHVQPNKNLFVTKEQKEAYQKRYEELYLFAKGTPGYDFKLNDVNDKTYTLSSFKGKVVVVDIWAMWCAPCLAEKPVMEEIAESYHDRDDIVFIGVSSDGLDKKEIWKAFVKRKGFTSVELLSNYTESIYKYYKVAGIPRFMVFDREGKIVNVDAPRPSEPAFKKLIDQTLKTEERVTDL
jgi:thiol-disulfide isomerase/thioredoxin